MAVEGGAAGWLPRSFVALACATPPVLPPAAGGWTLAVLAIDVAGFTALTERLAQAGPAGAEQMAGLLNARFGPLIDTIHRHGGDISHFAGDAIVAVWEGDAADTPARAAACALALQALPFSSAVAGAALPLRAGVAAGRGWWALLGTPYDPLHVVGGAPVVRAAQAAAAGQPGDVVIDDALVPRLGPAVHTAPCQAPPWRRVLRLGTALAQPQALPAAAAQHFPRGVPVPPLHALPRLLREGVMLAGDWLTEFRRITVLFAGFGDADFAAPAHCEAAQQAVLAAQAVVARYGGLVCQLLTDGPGATLIAAWGLPGHVHEGDARRGVAADMALDRALAACGLPAAIGVATGRVYCGQRGTVVRREWAVLGDRMNLAARLMRAAGAGVLCDDDTAQAARRWLQFDPQPLLRVKGKAEPVAVARPTPEPAQAAASFDARDAQAPIGRVPELAALEVLLAAHAAGAAAAVLVVEGEAGIGKTTLLRALAGRAAARGMRLLGAEADAVESATAYFVWRSVLRQLFPGAGDTAALRPRLASALATDALLSAQAPLLNDLLPLDLPESALTRPMEPQGRADALRDLMATLIARHAAGAPLVLVLDDAHWFDSASWALAAAVARRTRLLLVLGTRPLAEPRPPAFEQLLAGGAQRLALAPLSAGDTLALVCRRLGVPALPPAAEALLRDKAQGNPFFSEQLALALRDAGHLVVEHGQARLSGPALDLSALGLPDTVQGVVTGRIDRLPTSAQLALKVASVIGRVFAFRLLCDVYPVPSGREDLHGLLQLLTRTDLTRIERPEPDLHHLFTHVITQQVTYQLMSFAQRRRLHAAVAGWIEQQHGHSLGPYLQLLAWHWGNADEPARAVAYLERAAAQALERFANEEVLGFVAEARRLSAASALAVPAARRSLWAWYEGEALLKLARYADSRGHFEASLALLQRPVPATRGRLVVALLREAALQVWRRWTRVPAGAAADREAVLQAVHLHQRLAEVAYWSHDILSLVHSAVVSLNMAEPMGLSRQLQLAHQVLGFVGGLAGSPAVFARYRRRAAALGERVGHVETAAFCAQLEAIYFNGQARWPEMEAAALQGGALFQRIGERFRWQTCVVLRAWGRLHQGDVAGAEQLFDEASQLVRAEGPTQVALWCAAGALAVALARSGRAEPATTEALARLLEREVDHSDAILCRGLLAQALLAAGLHDAAQVEADGAMRLIDRLPPASFHTLLGNAAVCRVRLAAWQRAPSAGTRAAARHALRGLWLLAQGCPVARPALWQLRADFARQDGRPAAAGRAAARAVAEAARLGMR